MRESCGISRLVAPFTFAPWCGRSLGIMMMERCAGVGGGGGLRRRCMVSKVYNSRHMGMRRGRSAGGANRRFGGVCGRTGPSEGKSAPAILPLKAEGRQRARGGVGLASARSTEVDWSRNTNIHALVSERLAVCASDRGGVRTFSSSSPSPASTSAPVPPRVDFLDGSKRLSNYVYASVVTLGGTGFFLTGLSSFLQFNLLPMIHYEGIQTFPQGITLVFYGTCGLLLATYLWLLCNWNVGGGTNEYDIEKGEVTITRLGYPGKNRRIVVKIAMEDITGIRVEVDDGFQPRRAIYLQSKVRPDICLTPVGTPWTLDRLEETATSLARLIRKPLRGDI